MTLLELLIRFDQHLFKLVYTGLRPQDEGLHAVVHNFMLVVNSFGEFMVYPLVMLILWFSVRHRRIFFSRAMIISVAIALAAIVGESVKRELDRSRPGTVFVEPQIELQQGPLPAWHYEVADDAQLVAWFNESFGYRVKFDEPPGRHPHTVKSFPSGHALFAFALATALAAYYPFLKGHLLLLAALSALSRTYGGHHFLLDLAAGALIGMGVVLLALWALRRLLRWRAARKRPVEWWVRWLATGLPPEPPPAEAPRRLAKQAAFWSALFAFPLLVALAAYLGATWLAVAAGLICALGYVLGWRGLDLALRRLWPAPRFGGPHAVCEPSILTPTSTCQRFDPLARISRTTA